MAPPYYDHAGRILDGRYELVARVGAGAFATVYRAVDRNVHDRVVAVKVLHPERAGDEATVQRFLREVKLAVRITGKHRDRLVQILDQGYCEAERPGLLYFVMEFVEGATLQRVLRDATGGVLPWRRAVALGHEVAQALVALHGHGVIHRDIKPGNCILEEDRVRLLDLGIAKLLPDHESSNVVRLTLPNMVVGTLRYMAPEQQTGNACDERADLYAVGVMLYEFLTGSGPVFRELTEHPAQNKPLGLVPPSQAAPTREIPAAVDAVVMQALRWPLDERFQSASAMVAALAAALSNEPTDEWIRRPRDLPPWQRRLYMAAHALGVWMLLAGTSVAAASLALGVSLAHSEGGDAEPVALERDASPSKTQVETVVGASAGPVDVNEPDAGAGAVVVDATAAGEAAGTAPLTEEAAAGEAAGTAPLTEEAAAGELKGEAGGVEAAAGGASAGDEGKGGETKGEAGGASEPAGGASEPAGGASEPAGGASETKAGETKKQPPVDAEKESRIERAELVARFAGLRKRAISTCSVFSGLADSRGLKVQVRVQVRADGKVQARAQKTWQGTPLGGCVEDMARATEFKATELGGGFTWVLQF